MVAQQVLVLFVQVRILVRQRKKSASQADFLRYILARAWSLSLSKCVIRASGRTDCKSARATISNVTRIFVPNKKIIYLYY